MANPQLQKKFYNIEEMSAILGKSIASIYGHLARKQFDAVPVPMKLGRRSHLFAPNP